MEETSGSLKSSIQVDTIEIRDGVATSSDVTTTDDSLGGLEGLNFRGDQIRCDTGVKPAPYQSQQTNSHPANYAMPSLER